MISEKMREARDLIKAKRYSEARAILVMVDDPKAQQWLDHLDRITPPAKSRQEEQPSWAQSLRDDLEAGQGSSTIQPDQEAAALTYIMAAIGGLVGAVVGGIIWAAIAIIANLEIGYVAIGVGALAGWGVVMGTNRRKGLPFQSIAVVTALFGLFVGKYLAAVFFYRDVLIGEFGEAVVNEIGLGPLFTDVFQFFPDYLSASFEIIDILFVVIAIAAAWGIPSVKAAQRRADKAAKKTAARAAS